MPGMVRPISKIETARLTEKAPELATTILSHNGKPWTICAAPLARRLGNAFVNRRSVRLNGDDHESDARHLSAGDGGPEQFGGSQTGGEEGMKNAECPADKSAKCWLGRQDSNLRMAVPKTAALPLGYAPIRQFMARLNGQDLGV